MAAAEGGREGEKRGGRWLTVGYASELSGAELRWRYTVGGVDDGNGQGEGGGAKWLAGAITRGGIREGGGFMLLGVGHSEWATWGGGGEKRRLTGGTAGANMRARHTGKRFGTERRVRESQQIKSTIYYKIYAL